MTLPLRYPADRVCIVLLAGLGDVVLGLPLANALKANDPSRRITWVAEPMPARALANHPAVDEVIVFERKRGVRGVMDLRRAMAGREFDLTINLQPFLKGVWPTLFSGAPHRLGYGRDRAKDGGWLVANHRLPPRPVRHATDMILEFAQHLGIADCEVDWRLTLSPEEADEQRRYFEPLRDRPVVAIVPASGRAPKDWLPGRFAEVVDHLEHDRGFRTMIIGGPGAREHDLAAEIMARSAATPIQAMSDSVRRLVWLIGGSDLVIAPDTGPVHIARAMDVPVIGLYGHTNPYRWGPYRAYHDLWVDRYTDPGAAPDPSASMGKDGRMELITVADVMDRVDRAVEGYL